MPTQEIVTISKTAADTPAKDFDFLKEQGIRYIQRVAGNNWTDYNSHDPGITLLEQLTYAINDLAYRTSFDIKDLMAEENGPGGKQSHFFTARDILSCNPVSIDDLRKVIIDVPGIKNAWLEPRVEEGFYSDGPVVYYDQSTKQLSYQPGQHTSPIPLIGLYDVLLEFEYHTEFGHLNSNAVQLPVVIDNDSSKLNGFKAVMAGQFAYWDEIHIPDTGTEQLSQSQLLALIDAQVLPTLTDIDITLYHGYDNLKIRIDQTSNFEEDTQAIEVRDQVSRQRFPELEEELRLAFREALMALGRKYYAKVKHIRSIVNAVSKRLHSHRNLCEDYVNFKSLKVKELALCIKVDLKHNAVPDKVLANIYHAVELFLAPSLKWCSLEDLMNRRIPVDDIFEGPALESGFLTAEQLQVTDRRKTIHISDLINVIADIEGVEFLGEIEIGVKEDKVFKVKAGKGQWHLALDHSDDKNTYFIPRLNIDHSNVRFYKNRIPLASNRDEVNRLLSILRAESQETASGDLDLPIPQGQKRDVGEYSSIQKDMPGTYGIGERGLASSQPQARKAQAKQLKAYLLIFEQMLANYLAQLKNLNQLFSLDTQVAQTYFIQDLYDVPDVAYLFRDFLENSGFGSDPSTHDKKDFKDKWKSFMGDVENAYLKHLQEISEGHRVNAFGEKEPVFLDRRNRFLDHLMARFGEQIDEYATILHSIDSDVSGYHLIEDKALLLQEYPRISAGRGQAYNYLAPDTWPAQQVSGLERRIPRLLGIDTRSMSGKVVDFETYEDRGGKYRFRVVRSDGEVMLSSTTGHADELVINDLYKLILDIGLKKASYQKRVSRTGKFYFTLFSNNGKPIARSREYQDNEEKRLEEILMVVDQLRKTDEKLHIVEHILLRPKVKDIDRLLTVEEVKDDLGQEVCCPGHSDPYSFVVHVVLPSWPKRFRNLDFRSYIEERIRLETPAHLYPKICWVNHRQMTAFEQALEEWKTAFAAVDFNDELFLDDMGSSSFQGFLNKQLTAARNLIDLPTSQASQSPLSLPELMSALKARLDEPLEKGTLKQVIDLLDKLEKLEKLINRSNNHNQLIETISSLRNVYPEATLYDCDDSDAENPIALNRTKLGTFKPLEDE